jgi:cytochrome bd ubiquinol oxidase subunit II
MTAAEAVLAAVFVGLTAYALFAGADFGGGFWDLFAGSADRGRPARHLIERSIGPVWEANHVWLIFVLVVLWTGFPPAFAAVASTLYIPLTLTALGIIARGSAFAFRHSVGSPGLQRLFGACFAFSSIATPFFLGAIVGGVASGRVPPGIARGDVITSWLNPTSVLGGVLAVVSCAYLAAVYLCADARRHGLPDLAEAFRRRALLAAAMAGIAAAIGIGVLRSDARALFDGLTGRGLPLIVASGVAGVATVALLAARRYAASRVAAAIAVTAVIWGWGAGQYPYLLQGALTVEEAAAGPTTLRSMLVALIAGSVLLVPALTYLYLLFQRGPETATARPAGQRAPTDKGAGVSGGAR